MQKTVIAKEYSFLLRQLRAARKDKGVTQTQMAHKLRETQSFVSKCERGERRLDAVELRTWCGALGISFLAFLGEFDRSLRTRGGRT